MAVSSPRLPIASANFYEMLELQPFEPDVSRIQDRLREKMREFRKYQVGPYATQAEACLNRLAQARQCLLDAKQKLRYDEQLRNQFDLPPLTVRVSLPPDKTGSQGGATSQRWSAIVAWGRSFPGSVWTNLRQLFARSPPFEAAAAVEAVPPSDPELPAVLEPPPGDAPWVTLPVSESGPVSQAS